MGTQYRSQVDRRSSLPYQKLVRHVRIVCMIMTTSLVSWLSYKSKEVGPRLKI